jgi:anthranilate synthase/aminodeoxychorismate synthase-like glutamine amidotransferase
MYLLLDNYDSFTYNIYQWMVELGASPMEVVRNDAVTVGAVERMASRRRLEALVVSPGPGTPDDAGISKPLIAALHGRVPILGVCMGHQCIGEVFGGRVVRARRPMHGKVSLISHDGRGVFEGLANPFEATRYHSLVVEPSSVPPCLEVTARAEDGDIMGLRHREGLTVGVQFHPESIMTTEGKRLLANFIRLARGFPRSRGARALRRPSQRHAWGLRGATGP